MKKIFLALLAITFVSSLCFAQQPSTPAAQTPSKEVEIKAFAGKVDSVSLADPVKGTKSEIVVADENGNKVTFMVKASTPIYDVNSNAISLDKIKKDDKVKVKYIVTKEGVNEAISIRVAK